MAHVNKKYKVFFNLGLTSHITYKISTYTPLHTRTNVLIMGKYSLQFVRTSHI